jgi:transcriptional regulator with XRE-family HTH domain
LSHKARVAHNSVSRLEHDRARKPNIKVLGRLLAFFSDSLSGAFPEGDPYDQIIPPNTLGGWIKNQRLRRAMELGEFARLLRVHVYSAIRYERDAFRPNPEVQRRLRAILGPGIDAFLGPATILKGTDVCPAAEGPNQSES